MELNMKIDIEKNNKDNINNDNYNNININNKTNNKNGLNLLINNINQEKIGYSILICMNKTCKSILSSPIPNNFIDYQKNGYAFFESFFLSDGTEISNKKKLKEDKKFLDCYLYKNVKCINCKNNIGKFIISASSKYFFRIKKIEIKNYYAE
jgi:hypothetical protein